MTYHIYSVKIWSSFEVSDLVIFTDYNKSLIVITDYELTIAHY